MSQAWVSHLACDSLVSRRPIPPRGVHVGFRRYDWTFASPCNGLRSGLPNVSYELEELTLTTSSHGKDEEAPNELNADF